MPATSAQVREISVVSPQLTKLILAPTCYIPYQAGQYLQILLPDNPHGYSYSIANAPNSAQTYELHIRHGAEHTGNQHLIDYLHTHTALSLELPFGKCTLQALDSQLPILFIAGGTGFAPIKAMLEQLHLKSSTQKHTLIWRANNPADLYAEPLVKTWQNTHPEFAYYPQFNREPIQSFLATHAPPMLLSDWQIVLAGPFDMVYSIRDELIAANVPRHQLHSDAFAFEKNT